MPSVIKMPPKYAPNQKLTWWLHDYQRNIVKSQIQNRGLKNLFQTILPDHAPRAAAEAGLEQKYKSKTNLELTQCIVNYFSAFLHLREHEMIGRTVEQFNIQLITEPQITRVGSIYTQSFIFHRYNFLPSRFVHEALAQSIYSEAAAGSPVPPHSPGQAALAGGVNRAGLSLCKGGRRGNTAGQEGKEPEIPGKNNVQLIWRLQNTQICLLKYFDWKLFSIDFQFVIQ